MLAFVLVYQIFESLKYFVFKWFEFKNLSTIMHEIRISWEKTRFLLGSFFKNHVKDTKIVRINL